jgi:hypothetical protein
MQPDTTHSLSMRLRALKQDEYQAIRDEWNSMVMKAGTGVLGFDVTATYEWAMALWDSHLQGVQEEILLLEDGGQVKGVIPLFQKASLGGVSANLSAV